MDFWRFQLKLSGSKKIFDPFNCEMMAKFLPRRYRQKNSFTWKAKTWDKRQISSTWFEKSLKLQTNLVNSLLERRRLDQVEQILHLMHFGASYGTSSESSSLLQPAPVGGMGRGFKWGPWRLLYTTITINTITVKKSDNNYGALLTWLLMVNCRHLSSAT